MIERKLKIL